MKTIATEKGRYSLRHIVIALLVSASVGMTGCGLASGGNSVDADGTLHGRVSLSGAFALYPLAVQWGVEFKKYIPMSRLRLTEAEQAKV